jgi:GntR family transcriptional regulator/MocR family aminotransferase
MLPSFRLGYLIAPAWAVEPIIRAKRHDEWQSSSVMQAAAACFITDGHLSAHIARMRTLYAERKAVLVETIGARFGEFLSPLPSHYGLHLSALGNPAINWKSVSERARQERIHVRSLAQYFDAVPQPGLVFGIGAEPRERIRLAVDRLANLI